MDRQEPLGGQGEELDLSPNEKLAELKRLGALRRASFAPDGCHALSDFHNGYYETEFVSPWTKSACNVDAELALVLQDWCSSDYLSQPVRPIVRDLGHDPILATNRNLKNLLGPISIDLVDTFGTNAFPWIKSGAMNASLELKALVGAVENYLLPQLQTVQPKVAVLFGKTVYIAVCAALGRTPEKTLVDAIDSVLMVDGIAFATVAHTGSKIHLHRGWENSVADWRKIGNLLR